jgi:hypothetical protein
MNRLAGLIAPFLISSFGAAQTLATLDAITFYDQPNVLYLPARDAAKSLGWRLGVGPDGKTVYLNQKPVRSRVRELADGSALVPLSELKRRGLSVSRQGKLFKVRIKKRAFFVREGEKRVVVNKSHMEMRAWQGQRVVLAAPVTLGIEGNDTPTGLFKVDGYRNKMHKSKLYDNAPMAWAVHIVGNVFIHGWKHVEGGRGSHGCIRLPLSGGNPARFFYYWVDRGTPVSILGKWPRGAKGHS